MRVSSGQIRKHCFLFGITRGRKRAEPSKSVVVSHMYSPFFFEKHFGLVECSPYNHHSPKCIAFQYVRPTSKRLPDIREKHFGNRLRDIKHVATCGITPPIPRIVPEK